MASDREITLGDLWRAIWRGKWIVLATTVIAGLVARLSTSRASPVTRSQRIGFRL